MLKVVGDFLFVAVVLCRLIGQQLVKMQAVDMAAVVVTFNGLHFDTEPCLFPTLYKWLEHVPDAYSNAQQQARLSLHC